MRKVVFIDVVHNVFREKLTANQYLCVDATAQNKEQVLEQIKTAFGIVIRSKFTLDAGFLEGAVNLKFIARSGSGTENIDLEYCNKKGVQVFSSPEGNRNAVAEHALGFTLSLLNNIHRSHQEIKQGVWNRKSNTGKELSSCTIGVIGCGNNGLAFAKKMRDLGAVVLTYDKYKRVEEPGIKQVPLEGLYKDVDVLSFHVPETEETVSMGNHMFFSRFKKQLIVLNICRGKVIDTSGLVKAMKEKKVLKAALDVLEYETKSFEHFFENALPEDFVYLQTNPNVILTPHIAGWTTQSYYKLSNVLVNKILEAFNF
jgi:D-3-phosphoglycerate dehydrogenase